MRAEAAQPQQCRLHRPASHLLRDVGQFRLGDYFKEQAIHHAWTPGKEWGLDPERLLVTIYRPDDEAFDLWKKLTGFTDEKIIRIPTKDNFWAMGSDGPCGPCSEIFYDHGDHIGAACRATPEEDGDRFVEIWNLVFMQNEQFEADEIVGDLTCSRSIPVWGSNASRR